MLPFLLKPYLKNVIWGGSSLSDFKDLGTRLDHIGESWEVSGMPGCQSVVADGEWAGVELGELCRRFGAEILGRATFARYGAEFPLLVKYIDAVGDLSVQVHPDDRTAFERHGCRGKSEMWYVVDAKPGSQLVPGFSEQLDAAEFDRRVADGSVSDVLATCSTHPGDVFYIPAGRIHAIGAGNFLVEVQPASDITYRVFDYNRRDTDGRLRELHTEQARSVIDFNVRDDYRSYPEGERLLSTPEFTVDKFELSPSVPRTIHNNEFSILMCIGGAFEAVCEGKRWTVGRGHTFFIPAGVEVQISGRATLLLVVP